MLIWSREAFVSGLGLSLLHSLWQGALLGGVGFALHKRLKQATPDLRCGVFSLLQLTFCVVWLGTFLSLYRVAIHAMEVVVSPLTGPISADIVVSSPAYTPTPGLMHQFPSLAPLLVTAWALGVCVLSLRHLGGLLFLYRLCHVDTVPSLPTWVACAERLSARMGIGRKILLRCTHQIDVPCAFGLFKSYVMLPASTMMGLTPEQAEALIAHELAHIARHDVFFNSVQVCLETILFYHPVVWWLSMQIRVAREQSCDDLAVQIIGDRALYARALYSLEEARASIPQLALGAKGDSSRMTNWHLIHRIQRVLGVASPEKRDPWAKGALALCAATLGLAALMPVRAYSRPAQQDPPAKQDTTVKVVTKIKLNIHGDKIELNSTNLKPDTLLKVNGKEGRFSELTPQQQKELQQALKNVHVTKSKHNIEVRMHEGDAPGSANSSKVIVSKGATTKIVMSINGDKIELNTIELTPDTSVKVNGKAGRFGDLTPKQQEQLQEAVKSVHIHVVPDKTSHNPHAGTSFASATMNGGHTKIRLNINGDTVEITGNTSDLSTENLPANTLVSVNGKESRFGDLPESEQKAIRETKASVHVKFSSDAKKTVPPAPVPDKP